MKLELKHLAPYLPYKLRCMAQGEDKQIFDFQGISDITWVDLHEIGRTVNEQYDIEDVFPILRPLSDLTKEYFKTMDGNYGFNASTKKYEEIETACDDVLFWSYSDVQQLFENHFDVFGLIEKGLAIDINTL